MRYSSFSFLDSNSKLTPLQKWGVPPTCSATWGRGYPPPEKRREGVGGTPLPPRVRIRHLFLHGRILWFAWNCRREWRGLWVFRDCGGSPGRALRGEGVPPCWAGTWGGGYPPLKKKKAGG